MTQEKDIILHSKVMDKVVDIVNDNGLEIRIVRIDFILAVNGRLVRP